MANKRGRIIDSFFKTILILIVLFCVFPNLISGLSNGASKLAKNIFASLNESISGKSFELIASTSVKSMDKELKAFAKKNKINLKIDYYGDLEIVDILNEKDVNYDGVWISNSIWLYMLDNSYLVTNSKSIATEPVVFGIKKSIAQSLNFTNGNVYNNDILEAIKSKNLNYIMSSVTKTNTGATAYLGFLNSLAGSPELLTSDMLKKDTLVNDMKAFFNGVERVSGDEEYTESMFLNGNYDAMINYESSLIKLNQTLIKAGEEPLYLIYPIDGVAINDMPLGYVSHNQNKENEFKILQNYLRSNEAQTILKNEGMRTWYGGISNDVPKELFNSDWGINTNEYLMPLKYPSKAVMNEALNLYIEKFRKPNHTVFCLDVSGSMAGKGINELKDAMNYILDYNEASKDRLQFSESDVVSIVTFNYSVVNSQTNNGNDTKELINFVNGLNAKGGTNIYDASIKALNILSNYDSNEYTRTIILMTDGESNNGTFTNLKTVYNNNYYNIPIYGITFGDSNDSQLLDVANLTNAKVFDGKSGLKKAFAEVRSYN